MSNMSRRTVIKTTGAAVKARTAGKPSDGQWPGASASGLER